MSRWFAIGIYWREVPGRAVLEIGGRVGSGGALGSRQVAIHVGQMSDVDAELDYFVRLATP